MVQQSVVGGVTPSHAHDDNGILPQYIAEYPQNGVALPAKRRRRAGAGAPVKRYRREQRGLCELNLDELYIIFAYVYPMDLLNLARTCKSLRGILLHRSSRFLWKTSLGHIEGLPPCPADLIEPEYANLIFYNRCRNCDKPAKAVFWNMRRRYCPACRADRVCHLSLCDDALGRSDVVAGDWFTICDDPGRWVDREQMESCMREYLISPNKTEFLNKKQKQCRAIKLHAHECEIWQQKKGRVHRFDLEVLRKERQTSIFERLKQRGYGPEIAFFQDELIERSYRSVFKKHKLLTDSEWTNMWPTWVNIMNNFRSQRLETTLYQPRRHLLVSKYNEYVMHPSPDSPALDIVPHVFDVSRFPPFRDILRAPEETQLDDKLFAPAFAQLPILVDKWTERLNSEIAELVKIPPGLSLNAVSGDMNSKALGDTDLNKLRLACAVFHVGGTGAFTYPEILSVLMGNDTMFSNRSTLSAATEADLGPIRCGHDVECTGSIYDRFGLQFLDEAPYIIYACGLDPNVATEDDMDRRNARLRCLCCGGRALIMNWRHAIWHARFYHCISFGLTPLSQSLRWQGVGHEHINAIQAVERSVQKAFSPDWARCLSCRPRIGDAMLYDHALRHLFVCHGVEKGTSKEGVHYKLVGIRDVCVVEMVEKGEQVTFKVLQE